MGSFIKLQMPLFLHVLESLLFCRVEYMALGQIKDCPKELLKTLSINFLWFGHWYVPLWTDTAVEILA